jgi:hypothetical protein
MGFLNDLFGVGKQDQGFDVYQTQPFTPGYSPNVISFGGGFMPPEGFIAPPPGQINLKGEDLFAIAQGYDPNQLSRDVTASLKLQEGLPGGYLERPDIYEKYVNERLATTGFSRGTEADIAAYRKGEYIPGFKKWKGVTRDTGGPDIYTGPVPGGGSPQRTRGAPNPVPGEPAPYEPVFGGLLQGAGQGPPTRDYNTGDLIGGAGRSRLAGTPVAGIAASPFYGSDYRNWAATLIGY